MTREQLVRKALGWPSPHVRRWAGSIDILLQALDQDNIPWEVQGRRIVIGKNKCVVGYYVHPQITARQRSALVFAHRQGCSNHAGGEILRIVSLRDLLVFAQNPKRALGVPL